MASMVAREQIIIARRACLGRSWGRNTRDRSKDVPLGANQRRPSLPRPRVWRSARTKVPSGVPSRARVTARVLVESISSCSSRCLPITRVVRRASRLARDSSWFMAITSSATGIGICRSRLQEFSAAEASSGVHVQGLLGLFHCSLHDAYQPFEVSLRPAEQADSELAEIVLHDSRSEPDASHQRAGVGDMND